MFSKILVGNDGSESAGRALSAALALAKTHKAELHMISVEELPRFPASVDEVIEEHNMADHRFAAIISHAQGQAQALGVVLVVHVVLGHPVQKIIEFVEQERFELLVLGYMGHSALYNRLIGSTTDRLVEMAACHVLVVK
jgi:nucleotide-binding universal stress UspA family protein